MRRSRGPHSAERGSSQPNNGTSRGDGAFSGQHDRPATSAHAAFRALGCRRSVADDCRVCIDGGQLMAGSNGYDFLYWLKHVGLVSRVTDSLRIRVGESPVQTAERRLRTATDQRFRTLGRVSPNATELVGLARSQLKMRRCIAQASTSAKALPTVTVSGADAGAGPKQ